MSGHHVLTDHKGHACVVIAEQTLDCRTCAAADGRPAWLLKLPKPADPRKVVEPPTPIPPRYTRPTGVVTPPTAIPEWRELREKRWPKRNGGESS